MAITAKTVQELRARTGAGMMECKKALEGAGGDIEAAVDALRKAGLKSADKRAGRETSEGRVDASIADDGKSGSMVSLTSETDFVARTDDFATLLSDLLGHVAAEGPDTPDSMLDQKLAGGSGETVQDAIKQLSGKLGENIQVAQIARFSNDAGRVGAYVHHNEKTGALISVTTKAPADKVDAFIRSLGMHIAAIRPTALSREEIPADLVERERQVYLESDEVKSKPEDKREHIVKGKLEKFFKESVLLEQPWVLDPKTTVKKVLASELGDDAKIERYALFQVG